MPNDLDLQVDAEGRTFVMVKGLRVYVVSEAECERAAFVVCGNVSYFPDDVHAFCAWCTAPIVHRPEPLVPHAPPKICGGCVSRMLRAKES